MVLKVVYTEEELITLIRERNQKAFSYLYDHYSKALYGVVFTIIHNETEAEDVLQKTFLKIWDNFSSYSESKGRLYTWMLNIARNQAIDSTRSRHEKIKSKIRSTSDNVYAIENKFVDSGATHEYFGLKNIVSHLNEEHQLVIHLAYYEGYTQEEISKKLGIPLGTVKTKVRQAILKLRALTAKEHLQ